MGRWLLDALARSRDELPRRYGIAVELVAVGSRSRGLVHAEGGLEPEVVLDVLATGDRLASLTGVRAWERPADGLAEIVPDVLVDVSASSAADVGAAASIMRATLARGGAVVTSNKWPVALHGLELRELATAGRVPFRCESTVMSGTPVLAALSEGLAGARPISLRAVLNATANFILCELEAGSSYGAALARAQELGLAERDPSADVDGHDSRAKLMILAALVFGRQLAAEDVGRAGISRIDAEAVAGAAADRFRTRELATITQTDEGIRARLEPTRIPLDDPLARLEGADNAVICETDPVGSVMVAGPGAGARLAGQGVFRDLINAARAVARG